MGGGGGGSFEGGTELQGALISFNKIQCSKKTRSKLYRE